MMELVVSLTVVAACFTVVQLHHGVDHAGGLPTVGARQWAVPRPQLTDRRNRVELTVPDLAGLTWSDRGIVNCDKRRRKLFDFSCYSNRRDYRRSIRRARKSRKGFGVQRLTRSEADSVDEMERRLRQYQARRIAEEIARLRTIHGKPDTTEKRHRRRRRPCRSCRRRPLGGRRRTTSVVT